MKSETKNNLKLEILESRRLLSVVWQGRDVDGDEVVIKLSGAGDFDVTTSEVGLGVQIEAIDVFDTSPRSKLKILAYQDGGDGFVDVGEIAADGESLKQIKVDGNLGNLEVDALTKLSVWGSETLDGETAEWFIGSDVKKLYVEGDLDTARVEVGGSLRKTTIEGDLSEASLLVDGWLRRLTVYGDIADDSLVSVGDDIGAITVEGFIDSSTIETEGQLNNLYVGYDMLDSEFFAAGSIRRIVVDGAIDNTTIESEGHIRLLDVWDRITESNILAGPEGIDTIYAYDLIDTPLKTDGNIDHLFLDVS